MTSPVSAPRAVPLSVVMPVYNEEDAIALAVEDVRRNVLDPVPGAELVVVDDGSKDGTGSLLDDAAAADARIRVIHQANRGHGGALMAALAAARGDYVFLIDSDRQILLDGFPAAWALVESGRDGVFGVRRRRQDPALRLHLTRLIRAAIRLLFGIRSLDANVPYKLLRRSIWEEARACIPPGTLAPSLFLAIFTRLRGYDIPEIDVVHRERETGVVSIRRLRLLRFCARGFRQMMDFRRCVRRGR
jgi:glycosyltransferase involved in cell wall biosynthesis